MTINWKKTAIIAVDCLLGVYLLLAITAFNTVDEVHNKCREVDIHIDNDVVKGFLSADAVKADLQRSRLYPLGDLMTHVNSRRIEEHLLQNPFVKSAQCYKTQTGRVHINLNQRMPVIRVKADNGDDYYVDEEGNIMPNVRYPNHLVVATGHIQQKYAKKVLRDIGNFLLGSPLWRSQVEQLNVLPDGTVELVPRVGDHIVYLGEPVRLGQKLERLEKFYRYGLSKAGWNKYSYISLEFDNQIICKKR